MKKQLDIDDLKIHNRMNKKQYFYRNKNNRLLECVYCIVFVFVFVFVQLFSYVDKV